ncbi:hypothetical protein SAMN05446037_100658 [Anaerovirgula multivorans]|uniref:F5/8 type C domain-containing protein n=1 Tax=Anaerovirgula multivorans TaxID=312168 RepID=A0A239CMY0_9FIRM|nr:hypothetical protein [Anaerovirgula multivorans]SNS21480.1 hypothetical protein SAMN05446037_100658 [Anaerovirgula multivorans]
MANLFRIVPKMTGYTQDGFSVNTNSQLNETHAIWKLFDREPPTNFENSWFSGNNAPINTTITVTMPKKYCVKEYKLQADSLAGSFKYTTSMPRGWILQGSNNNETWTDLHSVSSEPTWSSSEIREYQVDSLNAYSFYRLYLTEKGVDPNNGRYIIAEFEIWGIDTYKHLIKSSNKIHLLSEGEWVETALLEPLTKLDFETYGMDTLNGITDEKLQELEGEEIEVIAWTDREGEKPKFLVIETDPFSPMERLNQEEEFEIIVWTDAEEEKPASVNSAEEMVDEGKLFKATLEDFIKVTGVEVN